MLVNNHDDLFIIVDMPVKMFLTYEHSKSIGEIGKLGTFVLY